MQFKIFNKPTAEELEKVMDAWISRFASSTKFEIQYRPVHYRDYRVEYTAFIRVIG